MDQVWQPSFFRSAGLSFFHRDLVQQVAIQLVESAGPRVVAATDAFAEGSRAVIGGWWIHRDAELCPEHIHWFSYEISREDLPAWFQAEDPEPVICALEASAHLVLRSLFGACAAGGKAAIVLLGDRLQAGGSALACGTIYALLLEGV